MLPIQFALGELQMQSYLLTIPINRDERIYYQSNDSQLYYVLSNGNDRTLMLSDPGTIPIGGMDVDLENAFIYWADSDARQIK
jgi:hypothetical protein